MSQELNKWNFDSSYNLNVDINFKTEFMSIMDHEWIHIIRDHKDVKLTVLVEILYEVYEHFSSKNTINNQILWSFIYEFINNNKSLFI